MTYSTHESSNFRPLRLRHGISSSFFQTATSFINFTRGVMRESTFKAHAALGRECMNIEWLETCRRAFSVNAVNKLPSRKVGIIGWRRRSGKDKARESSICVDYFYLCKLPAAASHRKTVAASFNFLETESRRIEKFRFLKQQINRQQVGALRMIPMSINHGWFSLSGLGWFQNVAWRLLLSFPFVSTPLRQHPSLILFRKLFLDSTHA